MGTISMVFGNNVFAIYEESDIGLSANILNEETFLYYSFLNAQSYFPIFHDI